MTLPTLDGKATLDISDFRQGIKNVRSDLAAVQELGKRMGTIRITADLSAAKDVQKATRAIRDAIQEAVPTDMQRRIAETFGQFELGANSAQQSAAVFAAQASALRARIDELDRAVKITRADFQAGFGEATPEETAKLTKEMSRLSQELEKVGAEAKENFGEYSREAQKVANANRLAQTTAAAARGEITRLGLASQVKLGVSGALQGLGSQAGYAANNVFGLAKASDSARIAQGLFGKTIEKTGQDVGVAAETVGRLQDTLGVTADAAREGIRGLLRQGFTLQQAYTALEGAGASALAAGQDASAGIDAITDAVASGSSARLNAISISENLSTYFQKEAKARGVTVDALDKQARAQATVNLITAATADEVGDLSALLGGVSGNLSSTSRELDTAGKKLGEAFIPLLTNGTRTVTKFLDVFNKLPEAGKNAVAILGASAIAVGFLAGPVSNLAKGYATIRDGLKGVKAASDGLAGGAKILGEGAENVAQSADAYTNLAQKARTFYASTSASLTTYISSTLLATGATNVFSKAFLTAVANTTLFTTSIGAVTVGLVAATVGVAALAAGVGYFSAKIMKETQAIYDAMDASNQKSGEDLLKRVRALNQEGSELSRNQARVLLLQRQLSDAQQGDLVGTTLSGERIYKVNEEAVQRYTKALAEARQENVRLFTEAQRRGTLNLVLTEDQTKAVKELQSTLAGRALTLKIDGLSEMDADFARLGRDFDELRRKFKQPFTIGGKLLDPAQTPALRAGLLELDTQLEAERAAVRKRYADQATLAARKSATEVQDAEIAAMRDGAGKKVALRQAELDAVRRDADEKVATLAGFPRQQAQLESDTRRLIAAKRRAWAEEDRQTLIENGKRVTEAENRAGAAVIASMENGLAKKDALRAQDLASLRQDVADRVAALAGDQASQAGVRAAGEIEIAAKQREQNLARLADVRETARLILDAENSARNGSIAALADGRVKREAIRASELADLKANIAEKVLALAGDPETQGRVQTAGNDQVAAKIREQNAQRVREEQDVQNQVLAARKGARDATLALIEDEGQKRRAAREDEVSQLRTTLAERLKAAAGYPAQQQAIIEAARTQSRALEQKWAREDEADAKARAQRIADAYQKVDDASASAARAGRENQAAQYELTLARRLAAAKGNAEAEARIEQGAIAERARLADQEARTQFGLDEQRLTRERDRALSNAALSSQEREAIWQGYYASLGELSGKFQAGEKQRLQQQEAAELAAAERIRAARVQAAFKPAEGAAQGLSRLQFEQGLTDSLVKRLALEQQVQDAQQGQADLYADVLSQAQQLGLTDAERKDVLDKLESSNRAVLTSQKAQLDYQRQISGEAQQVVDLYGQLVKLTGSETGVIAAQRDYAAATTDLGDAYARALPYLQQFREGSLKPDDFNNAKDALGGLVSALEAQRQKLEQLRGEYARQRDALASVQDVLRGFGQEFGDEGLLNNAIQFNQATYDQAKTALDTLLKGGQYDAAQLAEATKNLQSSYGGLKDSVQALGEARAKESEKEISRIKGESDARLKALDDQIKSARTRGDTGAVEILERQREQIVAATEKTVADLEKAAQAARDQAQKALTDRTQGLQKLLGGVQQGAAKAGSAVTKLSADVKTAEQEVARSAVRVRESLGGAFKGLPALAGKAGADSGKQFMEQLQRQLRAAKFPGVTGPGAGALPSARPAVTNITQSFVFNTKDITGSVSPNMKTLLKALAAEADAECRRRQA